MIYERVRWYHFAAAVLVVLGLATLISGQQSVPVIGENTGKLGIIPVSGPIGYGSNLPDRAMSPSTLSSLVSKAEDDGVDAILFEINSPGGSVVASKEAARIVEETNVPTVCVLKEVAASGAYWMASACDVIVADRLTLTGSIGVSSAYLEVSGLLDKLGVEYVNLTAGRLKDMGSRYKNITPEERARFNEILDTVHTEFIAAVADNRNMSEAAVEDVATGEIFLGAEAVQHGLVDRVGTTQDGVDAAKNLAGVTTFRQKRYEPPQQFDVLSLLFSKIGEGIVRGAQQDSSGLRAQLHR